MGISNPEAFNRINELLFEIHDLFDLTKLTTWSDHKKFAIKIKHCCRKLIALNTWNITKTCSMESICKDSVFTPTSRAERIIDGEDRIRERLYEKNIVDFFTLVGFQGRLADWWEAFHIIENLQHYIESKRDIHESVFLNEFRNLVGVFMLLKHELTPTKQEQHDESTMLWKWTLYQKYAGSSDDAVSVFRNMSQEKLAHEVSKLNNEEWDRDREYYRNKDAGRIDPIFGNCDDIVAKIAAVAKAAACDKKLATIALSMNHDDVSKAIEYAERVKPPIACDKEWRMSKAKIKSSATSIPGDTTIKSSATSIPGNDAATPINVTAIGASCITAPTDTVAIKGDGTFSPKRKAKK